jgi:sugar/nucleoside kinase (ribokinase family)
MNKAIAFLGRNCIDEYYELSDVPVLGEKVLCRFIDHKVGGMIGNAASIYAAYGNQAVMLDFMNESPENDILIKDLVSYGVDINGIAINENYPPSKCLIMLKDGERIIYVLDNTQVRYHLSDKQKELLFQCAFLYTSFADLLQIEDYRDLVKAMDAKGVQLIMDIEKNALGMDCDVMDVLSLASILFINEQADDVLSKRFGSDYRQRLLDHKCLLVLTKAEKGSEIYAADDVIKISAYPVEVVDTTGAGDTYNVSFLHAYNRGETLAMAGRFASIAASLGIKERGARSVCKHVAEVEHIFRESALLAK